MDEIEDEPITQDEVDALIAELIEGFEVDFGGQNQNVAAGSETNPTQPSRDPNNPYNVSTANIQPVAILCTEPSLSPNYELVLGADNQMYVLSRPLLRQLVPEFYQKKINYPVTSPVMTVDITKDTELLLDEILEHREAHQRYLKDPLNNVFNETTLRRLQIQMMKHVQLLGQGFIQAHGHPKIWSNASFFMRKLQNFERRSRTSATIRSLCWNLEDMYQRCLEWQKKLSVDNSENRKFVQWLAENENTFEFHPMIKEFIVTCKAFMFPELLPKYTVNTKKVKRFEKGEIQLMIMTYAALGKRGRIGEVKDSMTTFVNHYAPWRDAASCGKMFCERPKDHPASIFRATGQVPEIIPETMEYQSYDDVLEPSQRDKGTLPQVWDDYIFSRKRVCRNLNCPPKLFCLFTFVVFVVVFFRFLKFMRNS